MESFSFRILTVFIPGFLFGTGLALAGMLNPKKIIGFLDLFGSWDPSLAFVMIGGVLVNAIGFQLCVKRRKPVFEKQFNLPSRNKIDKPLIVGSAIFGIGWGLSGFCPGPVVASLFINLPLMVPFFCILILGLLIGEWLKMRIL